MSAQLAAGETVRVVAPALANGAPHPLRGRDGVVLEVRDVGRYPVRVLVDGRPIMFASAELERHPGVVSHGETAVRDVR